METDSLNPTVASQEDLIYYGPYACERCGEMICRVSREQGGADYTYPTGPIYPNTQWHRHTC